MTRGLQGRDSDLDTQGARASASISPSWVALVHNLCRLLTRHISPVHISPVSRLTGKRCG
jgi:hypothetical protein